MIFLTDREDEAKSCLDFVMKLIGQKKAIEVGELSPLCTKNQNSYLQVLLKYFGACLGYTRKEAEYIFMKYVNEDIYTELYIGEDGKKHKKMKELLSVTERDMSVAIERFINYSAMNASVALPHKDDTPAMNEAKKIIYLNKMFL